MRSLKMTLIYCKVELKLQWTKFCVLSAAGNDKTNASPGNILSLLKTQNYMFLL